MCEKRKKKMIIEIALLLINEFTPEYISNGMANKQVPLEQSKGIFVCLLNSKGNYDMINKRSDKNEFNAK